MQNGHDVNIFFKMCKISREPLVLVCGRRSREDKMLRQGVAEGELDEMNSLSGEGV